MGLSTDCDNDIKSAVYRKSMVPDLAEPIIDEDIDDYGVTDDEL